MNINLETKIFSNQADCKSGQILCCGSKYYGASDVVDEILFSIRLFENISVFHYEPMLYKNNFGNESINHQDITEIPLDILYQFSEISHNPIAVILIAGGLSLSESGYKLMASKGVPVITVQLSDPDDYLRRGIEIQKNSDLLLTNSVETLTKYKCESRFLLWGRSDRFNFLNKPNRENDIIIMGAFRDERLKTLEQLFLSKYKIHIVGTGWNEVLKNNNLVNLDTISIDDHAKGLSKYKFLANARYYLSYSQTSAGFFNLKNGVYEAFSCGTKVITDWFPDKFRDKLLEDDVSSDNIAINIDGVNFSDFISMSISENSSNETPTNEGWGSTWKTRLIQVMPEIFA